MIFFWNRYELPAIMSGQISFETQRMMGLYHIQSVLDESSSSQQEGLLGSSGGSSSSNGGMNNESSPISAIRQGSSSSNDSTTSVVSTGQDIQRMRPSYPSMSSLGRISSYDGFQYWANGEVIMRRNSSSAS